MSFTTNDWNAELVLVYDSQSQISTMAKRAVEQAQVSMTRVFVDIRSSTDLHGARYVPTVLLEHGEVRHVMPGHITSRAVETFVSKFSN